VGYHRIKKADITICSHWVTADAAKEKGVVLVDPVGRVTGFHEKPGARVGALLNEDSQALVNMGVYVFKRDAMLRLLEEGESKGPMEHIGHHVIPAALETGARVFAYEHEGYWRDVSTLRDYYEANIALTSTSKAPIKFFELERAISSKKGKMLPPAKLCGSVEVDESILGDGCILSDGCVSRRSIIGENVLVGAGSVIEDSLLLGSPVWTSEWQRDEAKARGDLVFGVGRNVHLKGCVVDENAYVGDGCVIKNADGVREADRSTDGYMIEDGIVVVLRNAVIPDGTVI
jgi:glucose-1-phosphate adenylyltransferase